MVPSRPDENRFHVDVGSMFDGIGRVADLLGVPKSATKMLLTKDWGSEVSPKLLCELGEVVEVRDVPDEVVGSIADALGVEGATKRFEICFSWSEGIAPTYSITKYVDAEVSDRIVKALEGLV